MTIETQALIIGAGPVGLFQVFQLGLLEIKAHVVDALAHPGGQCAQLYPDKPIYDIPALPATTGKDLTELLLKQIAPFSTPFHLGQEVIGFQTRADGRFDVATSAGTQFITQTLFIAAGVGAFAPRQLKLDGLQTFANRQVHHSYAQPQAWAGQRVLVLGGDDAALQAALELASTSHVTLVHRRATLEATPALQTALQALVQAGSLEFVVGQVTAYQVTAYQGQSSLASVHITTPENSMQTLAVDHLLVCWGLSPKLGPLTDWGLAMQRKQLTVNTETFATSTPGIFAVGDINTYPGKKKLILCGFHEATLAAYGAAEFIDPDRKIPLQYTTTSPRLHQLLGVL
jgi:thioredoxin reductase (NADPH)